MKSMQYQYENIPGVNPFLGAMITFLVFLFGRFLPDASFFLSMLNPFFLHIHIPPAIIESAQVFAYCGTGIVGLITGYKFYKESIKPKIKKK